MTEFCALRAKAYTYKLDDDTEHQKAKDPKKCVVKRESLCLKIIKIHCSTIK